ncbi:MAG: ATP-binding protein [Bacteroidia bacterium]|nr:ATP-binding protein [Bacteroidia bacterium]
MVKRELAAHIRLAAQQMPVISITGPRQSGKTTLCRSLFPDYFYANLENPETRQFALEDPRQFLAQGKDGMVIDEAQYAPLLFSYIQTLVDERKRNGAFILSGSQNFLLMEKITQSLAGRVAVFHLLPFSLRELQASPYPPAQVWELIFRGGYPRIYDQEVKPGLFFPGYLQTYVERDLRQLANIGDLQQFQLFTRLTAGRIGQLFNQSAIANEAGATHSTIKRWFSLLQTSFVACTLPPYYRNFNKQLIKTPKLYFYDTGLACYLLGIRSPEELEVHHARGALFENFIITETLKHQHHQGNQPSLYFWRDRTGHEIDLLIDTGRRLHPVEIKSGQSIQPHFFSNLAFFSELSGGDPSLAALVYAGEERQQRSSGAVCGWRAYPDFLSSL